MLKIKDLTAAKELDAKAMTRVVGGFGPFAALFDASFRSDNKVADVAQVFDLKLNQINAGTVTNNQAFAVGNGRVEAPVEQRLIQGNALAVGGLGGTFIA